MHAPTLTRDVAQSLQESLHFATRVVVRQANEEEAAARFNPQAFGEVDGVVVTIPSKDTAIIEAVGELRRSVAWVAVVDPNGDRRTAMGEAGGVGNAVELEPGDG